MARRFEALCAKPSLADQVDQDVDMESRPVISAASRLHLACILLASRLPRSDGVQVLACSHAYSSPSLCCKGVVVPPRLCRTLEALCQQARTVLVVRHDDPRRSQGPLTCAGIPSSGTSPHVQHDLSIAIPAPHPPLVISLHASFPHLTCIPSSSASASTSTSLTCFTHVEIIVVPTPGCTPRASCPALASKPPTSGNPCTCCRQVSNRPVQRQTLAATSASRCSSWSSPSTVSHGTVRNSYSLRDRGEADAHSARHILDLSASRRTYCTAR